MNRSICVFILTITSQCSIYYIYNMVMDTALTYF